MNLKTTALQHQNNDVFIPHVDETPVPCPDGYTCTDCVYLSDLVNCAQLGIPMQSSMTTLLNEVLSIIGKQEKEIMKLNNDIKRLKDYGNKR